MNIVDSIFSIARNITDGDLNEVNKLHEKAKNQTETYHTDMAGIKGLYARLHKGWILQTVLIFAVPFITAKLMAFKQSIMLSAQGRHEIDENDEYEDEDEQDELIRLKRKYERD